MFFSFGLLFGCVTEDATEEDLLGANIRWIQRGCDIDGEAAYDWSGSSVIMPDVNTLAVGAIMPDGNANPGQVRIFTADPL